MNIYKEIREREILNEFMIVLFVRRYNTDSVYIYFIYQSIHAEGSEIEREREREKDEFKDYNHYYMVMNGLYKK